MPEAFARRYAWASSPGKYGGNWCSPAPLYRQLAPKANASARTIDLTSFEFVTATPPCWCWDNCCTTHDATAVKEKCATSA